MNRRLTAILLALIMLFSMLGGAIAEEGESVSALIENALETAQPSAEETDPEVQRVMDKISAIGTVTAQSASAIQEAENAFEALSDAQKALVANRAELESAKRQLQALTDEEENAARNQGICGSEAAWGIEDGVLIVSGRGEMSDYNEETAAPWADYAQEIQSVVVEKDISSIGDNAFCGDYPYLTALVLPDTLQRIGENAFAGCAAIESVVLPQTLGEIGNNAFLGCENLNMALFAGTPEEYARLSIGEGNDALLRALNGADSEETLLLNRETLSLNVGDVAELIASKAVEWSSSDESVIVVHDGTVTAVSEGTAVITAKTGDQEAVCTAVVAQSEPARLARLTFRNGTDSGKSEFALTPAFDPDTRSYTLTVQDSVNPVNQFAAWATLAEGEEGGITFNYTNLISGKSERREVISGAEVGTSLMGCVRMNTLQENTLTIQIGGADAYTVRILKQPTLKSLNFTAGSETIELNETLDAWKREYTASVPYDAELIVNASATVDGVEVRVNGETETAVKPEWTNLTAELVIALNADGAAESAYTVRLRQKPVKLEIAVQPVKTEYAIGETFDPAGLELRAVYADESAETVPAEAIEYEPSGALTKDVSAITLKYAGLEIELPIRVGGALKGSGTAEDPWKIESAADFETVRELVEKGMSFSGEYLEMTEDVTLPDGWSPIGASMSNPFSGNLNGADHTLTIPENGLPLLGCVKGAKVSHLNIYGKKIAGYGLVNDLQGVGYSGTAVELEHITLKSGSATLKSGLIGTTPTVNQYAGCSKDFIVKISDCTVESGVVIGYNRDQKMIGSIAGRVNGTISGCTSAATVYGTDYVGGILGTRDNALGVCEVRNCAFTGAVIADGEQAGGVVGGGYSDSSAPNGIRISVIGCSASGSVSGRDKVGGILGGDIFVAQTWDAYTFADNRFTGTVSGSGSAVGGVIGYYRSLNKWDDITGNYYASGCGASGGFGFVQYVDTNCASHETASGATYFNTENDVSDCPAVTGCAWKKAHNRTDDPLGADAAKLMRTDGTEIVEVTSVALDKTELNLKIGETAILNANVTPENATDKTVRWSSSDESVAAVLNGTVTAKGFGMAVITASAGGFTAECAVQVTAEPAEAITVTMTVSNRGVIAKASDGSAMFNRDVNVSDLNSDGILTYDEALAAAHAAYCPNGYASEITAWGVSVSKLWGVETMNSLFYLNDAALNFNVGDREHSALSEGDYLVASVNKDDRYYADHYTAFSKRASTATAGEAFTIQLNGTLESNRIAIGIWTNGAFSALENASVGADGAVTATFTEEGAYLLTAEGTVRDTVQDWSNGGANVEADCPIIAPGCWVKVEKAGTIPDAKPVGLTISGDYRRQYAVGERLNLKNMILTVSYSDGTTREVSPEDALFTGFDTSTRGEKTVTVSYGGVSASFVITVTKPAGTIDVTLTLLGDSNHGSGKVHTLSRGGLTTWVKATSYNVKSGSTVWDVLKQCLDEHQMPYSNASGNYVSSINGLSEFDNGKNSGWMYTLNGKYPLLGISEQKLKDGDRIVFHYTDDYTLENTGFSPDPGDGGDENPKPMMVEAVEKLIDNIGAVTLDSACKAKIDAARKAYTKLSYAEKQQVGNYKTLQDAEAEYSRLQRADDQAKADAVSALIDAMGSDEQRISEARDAYDQLTDAQKKLVRNYELLLAAEYQRASAIATDKDKARANDVVSAINAIGVQIDEDSANAIANARGAYDRLTDTQKALITNADQLKNAEAALEKLNGLNEFRNLYFETGDYLEKLGTPQVGSIGGEWMAIGLARSGRSVDAAYFERALDYVSQNIDENERLNANKCTENTRLILALTALGMDATDVGGYNLIDGLGELGYVRNQGINGPVWALIALDSNAYEPLPEGDATREALIGCILDAQLEDGGWAFTGDGADTDMTAMALQAIAPYYDPAADADNELNAAIERGVECLSMLQDSGGLFGTYAADGAMTATSESASQVIVALTALGIDPDQDERFIKNGVSALDALIHFGVANGGFAHLENAERDAMATEQGYYALTAYARYLMQLNRLYDMTDSFNDGENRIEPLRLYIGIAPKA